MRNTVILFIKGFFIGIAKIIPGVSGSILAITFNLYEKCLDSITNFFKNPIVNFKFLFKIGLGIIFGITIFSKVLIFLLNNYYFLTILFFIGLIINGLINQIIINKNKNYKVIFISFLLIFIISKINVNNVSNSNNILLIFISGIIDAISSIIPGLSGTVLLMLLGSYNQVINIISNLTNINFIINNINIIITFIIGLIIGILLTTKIMTYLFKNHKENTNSFILGISLSTFFLLIEKTYSYNKGIKEVFLGFIFLLIGYFISIKINN